MAAGGVDFAPVLAHFRGGQTAECGMEAAVAGGEERAQEFPLAEARQIVRDLMTPEPRIYWLDFGGTITLAWAAFALALWLPAFSAGHLLAVAVAGFAFYRAAIFIHEL
ncbi:MAG: hypothetical protein CVT80_02225, partial [Alphaproteobacteria bacterium HGW-Alphaproteobacteria-2]